jgi:hypothetical protein
MWWVDWDKWLSNLTGNLNQAATSGAVNTSLKNSISGAVGSAVTALDDGNRPYTDKAGITDPTPVPPPGAKPSPSPSAKAPVAQTPASAISAAVGSFEAGMAATTQTLLAEFNSKQRAGESKYDLKETDPVFMGGSKNPPRSERAEKWPASRVVEMGAAINDIYSWDDKKTLAFSEMAQAAGYDVKPTINKAELLGIWGKMVNIAAGSYAAGKKVTPWGLMKLYASGGDAAGRAQSKTTTNVHYSVTDALTAEQLAHAALSERLGRNATPEEVSQFKAALNAAEKKSPTVTTTTTDAQGNTTSTTKEGMSSATAINAFTSDWAMEHNPAEAAAYQTAGQLMPWFFEALGAGV